MLTQLSRLNWRDAVLIPVLLFAVALGLRCWGIDNGLPYGQRPDESSDIAESLNLLRGEPPTYAYHRVAWPLTQIPVEGLNFVYQRLRQPNFDVAAFENLYFTDHSLFILSARIFAAALASGACAMLYFAGRLLTGSALSGLIAGGLLAILPAHTYLSHIALPDAYATLWIAVALLGAILIVQKRKRWAYGLAGFGAAVSILARLQALPLVLTLIGVAHVIGWWQMPQRSRRYLLAYWLWALGGFVVAHLIFNPYLFLNPARALADIGFIFTERYTGTYYQPQATFNPLGNLSANWSLPLAFLRPYIVLPMLFLTGWAALRRQRLVLGIALAAWVFVISLAVTTGPRITYWLPAAVPMCLVVGWGLWDGIQTRGRLLAVGISLLIGAAALTETVKIDSVLAQRSTQMLAYDFVTANIPAEARIMQGDPFIYSIPLARSISSIERLHKLRDLPFSYQYALDHPAQTRQPAYDLFTQEYAPQIGSDAAMRAFLAENRIDYVIQTDYCGGIPPYGGASAENFPVVTPAISSEMHLIFTASPFSETTCLQSIPTRSDMEMMNLRDWERTGPVIRIYRVND